MVEKGWILERFITPTLGLRGECSLPGAEEPGPPIRPKFLKGEK